MSIRTVNVGLLSPLQLLECSSYLEGPTFYAQLRLKLTISGSRSHTDSGVTRSETMSFSKEVTLDRVPLELAATAPTAASAAGGLTTFGFDYAEFTLATPASGDFSLATERWDSSAIVAQQIGRQTLQPFYDPNFTAEVCGTWSETGNPDPADDDSGNIEISAFPVPLFWLSTAIGYPDNYRTPADRWGTTIIVPTQFGSPSGTMDQVDLSGWTNAQWRSKLGVHSVDYTETTWGIAGSTTDVTATFEWELS